MAIKYEQWRKILSAVNSDNSLNNNNVIKKIKKRLPLYECGEWSKTEVDVHHPFDVVFDPHSLRRSPSYECGE
jgi:hypothetical protein